MSYFRKLRRRRTIDAIVAVVKEAAEIEQGHYALPSKIAKQLRLRGLHPRKVKKAIKAAMKAGERVHFDWNVQGLLRSIEMEGDERVLQEKVRNRGHLVGRALVLLLLANTTLVSAILTLTFVVYRLTHSVLVAACSSVAVLLLSTTPICALIEKIVFSSISLQKPLVKTERIGPPLALMRDSARRVAARRFRRYTARTVASYALMMLFARLFMHDLNIPLIVPAPIIIVVVSYVELLPLRNWHAGLLWNLLHWPKSEDALKKQLP